jgi:hypothetical protein
MRYTRIVIGLAVIATFSVTTPVHAQFQLESYGVKPDLTYSITPDAPGPNDPVSISLHSYYLDLSNANIEWMLDGKTMSEGTGLTEVSTVAGAQGTEHDVTAIVTTPDGAGADVTIAIIPTSLDLLYDANSYVPPFYMGRAMPSSGTTINIQALPNFVTPEGKRLTPDTIVYNWKQDGRVLKAFSGKGKSSLSVAASLPHDSTTVSVDAVSADGRLHGAASVRIPTVESAITLYQDHPLFGIQYYSAMGTPAFVPDTEMTFAVAPYFAPAHASNDPALQYTWQVNGMDVPINASAPNEITIDASKSSGFAWINVAVSHITDFFTNLADQWDVQFAGSPNDSTPQNDVFHNPTQ